MLNRRRYPHDIDDNSINEHQALLDTSKVETNAELPRVGEPIGVQIQPTSFITDRLVVNSNHRQGNEYDQVPLLNHSSASQFSNNNINSINSVPTSRQTASILTKSLHQTDHGDSYQLSRVGNNSSDFSMNVDDIRYKQTANFIHYTIQPGDTLQNLSVRYSCPVASIKRLNNLWTDQEFFGLKKIKLPLGRFRLLENVIHEVNPIEEHTGNREPLVADAGSAPGVDIRKPNINSNRYTDDWVRTDSLFKNLDTSIERARLAAKSYDDSATSINQTLARTGNLIDDPDSYGSNDKRQVESPINDLSDFGLSYNFLLLFILIVCLICPLAYVIYLEETDHHYNHHQYQPTQPKDA